MHIPWLPYMNIVPWCDFWMKSVLVPANETSGKNYQLGNCVKRHNSTDQSRSWIQILSKDVDNFVFLCQHQAAWHNVNAQDLYSGNAQFQSQQGHQLSSSKFFMVFPTLPHKRWDSISIRLWLLASKSFPI
jgi:hypothetical protein